MGYYTAFNVEIKCNKQDEDAIADHLADKLDFEVQTEDIPDEPGKVFVTGNLYTVNSSWDDDFRKLSETFPSAFIELSGEGDASDDFWKAYFLGGLMQFAPGEIIYDKFDPEKLQGKEP